MADIPFGRSFGFGRAGVVRYLDLVTVGSVMGLAFMGLLAVYTATVDPDEGGLLRAPGILFNRQLVFCFLAGLVLLATILFDYRYFKIYAGVMYVGTLLLLLIVLTPVGEVTRGSQRWISLGILKLQPSELSKPVLLSTLAAYLSERRHGIEIGDVLKCVGLSAPFTLLVFLQPDFGTMLVLTSILVVVLLVGGADWRHLLVLLATGAAGVIFLFNVGIVHEYQRTRLEAFLDPAKDPDRAGYNYRLTKQAVGNGGFSGQGILRRGSLTQLDFVPEQRTDFVFTVIAEQMGFLGGATLLGLYGVTFARGLRSGAQARDMFGTLLATGAVGYMAFQVFVNVGMTVGLVPITGIPLPFVSYGGSSLVSSAMAVGMLLSVRMRRFARPLP
jgi:rod shape determining protein RodA